MTAVNFPRSFDVRYEIAPHECQTIRFAEISLKLRIAGRQPEVAEGENAMLSDIYPIQSVNRSSLAFVRSNPRRCVALQADYD